MKLIIKILAIILIINLIGCSFRRLKKSKSKSKTSNFDGSELEYQTKIIAGKMCNKVGRAATYAFFKNMDNYLSGSLQDSKLYDAIWGTTFKTNSHLDMNTVSQSMFSTVQVALGGNWDEEPQAYWDAYVKKMAADNARYLKGLVAATKGQSAAAAMNPRPAPKMGLFGKTWNYIKSGFTNHGTDALEIGNTIHSSVVDGNPALEEYNQFKNSDGDLSQASEQLISKAAQTVIETVIYLLQRKMLNDASSNIFNAKQGFDIDTYGQDLIGKGSCSFRMEPGEGDSVNPPYFHGNVNAIDGMKKMRKMKK